MPNNIHYCCNSDFSAKAIRSLLKRSQWNDYLSQKDVEWYLAHTLYVVSAWHGRRAVGIATLVGDGRVNIELDILLVDEIYQRQGIGKTLIGMVVTEAKRLCPYHFKVEVFEDSTEKLYAKFGFEKNEGTWLLQHQEINQKLRKKTGR